LVSCRALPIGNHLFLCTLKFRDRGVQSQPLTIHSSQRLGKNRSHLQMLFLCVDCRLPTVGAAYSPQSGLEKVVYPQMFAGNELLAVEDNAEEARTEMSNEQKPSDELRPVKGSKRGQKGPKRRPKGSRRSCPGQGDPKTRSRISSELANPGDAGHAGSRINKRLRRENSFTKLYIQGCLLRSRSGAFMGEFFEAKRNLDGLIQA
jgi:hypothetical protein